VYLPYFFGVSSCLDYVESGVGVDKGETNTHVGMLWWMKVVEGARNLVGQWCVFFDCSCIVRILD
jgi:hypothetical protein